MMNAPITNPAYIEALAERLEERWERTGATAAPKINRILLERKEAAAALRALLVEVTSLKADNLSLRKYRTEQDCRFTMGRVADMSGSHCPLDDPCTRCELIQLRADLATANASAADYAAQAAQIAALQEALVAQAKFVDDYLSPWGSWKTPWWKGEVSDEAAYSDNNALKHVANKARAAFQVKP